MSAAHRVLSVATTAGARRIRIRQYQKLFAMERVDLEVRPQGLVA